MIGGPDTASEEPLPRCFETPAGDCPRIVGVCGSTSTDTLVVQPLQTEADALARPADRPLDSVQPLADLADRVTLQAELDDRAVIFIQVGEQPVHGLAQLRRLERRRLAAGNFPPRRPILVPGGRGSLPRQITTTGAMIGHALGT